jgi:hypothetical protein
LSSLPPPPSLLGFFLGRPVAVVLTFQEALAQNFQFLIIFVVVRFTLVNLHHLSCPK